jgi:hypothetical protein
MPEHFTSELDRENAYVLSLGQALLGLVSPSLLASAVEVGGARVTAHFWVVERGAEVMQDIDEIMSDLDGFSPDEDVKLLAEIHVGYPDVRPTGPTRRLVHLVKRASD